jgi:SAM-dependent methyltransferase
MRYDPIKKTTGNIFNCCRRGRILFYWLLNLLLLRSWYIRKEIKKWAESAPQDASVLDAGSGFGQYAYYVSRLSANYSVKGIDLKQDEIDICNRFFAGKGNSPGIIFDYADLTTFTEPDQHDLILCVDVLEHIQDDVKVMENLFKSLKKGGMLIISTPSDQGGSDVHEHGDDSFIDEHVRDGYSVIEIEKKLQKAGFRRIESMFSYGKPGQLSWRLSMKYPIRMLNLGKVFFVVLPFYYLVTFPFSFMLNLRDLGKKHPSGSGLIVKAIK